MAEILYDENPKFDIEYKHREDPVPVGLERQYLTYVACLYKQQNQKSTHDFSWFDMRNYNHWLCAQPLEVDEVKSLCRQVWETFSQAQVRRAIERWEDYDLKLSNPLYHQVWPAEQWLREHRFDLTDAKVLEELALYRLNPLIMDHLYQLLAEELNLKEARIDQLIDNHLLSAGTVYTNWGIEQHKEFEPPKAYVKGTLYEGSCSFIGAAPKAAKSTLARDLIYCVSAGRAWLGLETMPLPCCYITTEDTRALFNMFFRQLCQSYGPLSGHSPDLVIGRPDPRLLLHDFDESIQKYGTKLFVLDTLFSVLDVEDSNNYPLVR